MGLAAASKHGQSFIEGRHTTAWPEIARCKTGEIDTTVFAGTGGVNMTLLCRLILAAFLFLSIASQASAQLSKSSGGITFTISKVIISGQSIIIRFNAKNNTTARVYLRDTMDDTRKALLGSGPSLSQPSLTGLEQCTDSLSRCVNLGAGDQGDNLNNYNYIEPGEFMSFGLAYQTPSPASESDTISFGLAMAIRRSTPNGNPQEAGTMQAVRQNFSDVPLGNH